MDLTRFALAFTSIFVALDIVGMLPMFITMTGALKPTARRRVANRSMGVAFVVALVFVAAGQRLFGHLGITVFDFKIAGGLVLLLVALADLKGGPEATRQESGSTGIVPLAVPLITGPGVLTTIILQVGTAGYVITVVALVLNYLLAWVLLRSSDTVTRLIGRDGTIVISKIAALFLAAIAVAMIRSGAFEAIDAFRAGVR
jgi:multiple antibiotic resistance protein